MTALPDEARYQDLTDSKNCSRNTESYC